MSKPRLTRTQPRLYTEFKPEKEYFYKTYYPMSKRQRAQSVFAPRKSSSRSTKSAISKPMHYRRSRSKSLTVIDNAILKAQEHKYQDYYIPLSAIQRNANSTGLMLDPNTTSLGTSTLGIGPVDTGDDSINREGRSITVDQLEFKGFVRFDGAEATADPPDGRLVDILIFQDSQTNAAQCNSQDVVVNLVNGGLVASSPLFFRNPNGWTRFTSLKRFTIACPPTPIAQLSANNFSWGSITVPWECVIKFRKPIKIRFNATTPTLATIASIVDNSFHVLAAYGGDSPAVAYGATLAYNCRMRFYG